MECNLAANASQVRYRRVSAEDQGMRLDNYLIRALPNVPRSHIYRIIRSGEVRVNRGRAKPDRRLAADDDIRVPPVRISPSRDPGRPPDALLERVRAAVLAESEDWLLLNKPPGLAVHAGSGLRFGVIEVLRALRNDAYLELVHRLDRDTSGCLLLARSRASLNELRAAWRNRQVEKRYVALVTGAWQGGARTVDARVLRDAERGGERISQVHSDGKIALSRFEPLEVFAQASLMAVTIVTGRTHQIRVHAAHIGHPVAGDDKYGRRAANRRLRGLGLRRMFLHAQGLRLTHSNQRWQAPLAADLSACLEQLRRGK